MGSLVAGYARDGAEAFLSTCFPLLQIGYLVAAYLIAVSVTGYGPAFCPK